MERENKDLDNFTDYVIKSEGTEGANHIILRFSLLLYFVLLGETFLQYTFIENNIWEYLGNHSSNYLSGRFLYTVEKIAALWKNNITSVYSSLCLPQCDHGWE